MNIDKPTVPKIPEPPLGVSRETLGDPCGGDGGGGGERWMRDWSGGRARGTTERRQMRDGTRRGISKIERSESGDPRGGAKMSQTSVTWRRIRDSHWKRTGEWLEDVESLESPSIPRTLGVPEPEGENVSQDVHWRPWVAQPDKPQDLTQTVSRLQSSVVGSHKEAVQRDILLEHVPSSNLSYFVRPVPHTSHEVYPSVDIRTKKSTFKGKIVYSISAFVMR